MGGAEGVAVTRCHCLYCATRDGAHMDRVQLALGHGCLLSQRSLLTHKRAPIVVCRPSPMYCAECLRRRGEACGNPTQRCVWPACFCEMSFSKS
jgi:hypothetical protein